MRAKEGKKNRKLGRDKNRPAKKRYNAEHRDLRNKEHKLASHVYHFPNDDNARYALQLLLRGVKTAA